MIIEFMIYTRIRPSFVSSLLASTVPPKQSARTFRPSLPYSLSTSIPIILKLISIPVLNPIGSSIIEIVYSGLLINLVKRNLPSVYLPLISPPYTLRFPMISWLTSLIKSLILFSEEELEARSQSIVLVERIG